VAPAPEGAADHRVAVRTVVICSAGNVFNRRVLPAYLASISDLVGIVAIDDKPSDAWRRLKYEWRRSRWRILDVFGFRIFYRLKLARRDAEWIRARAAAELARLEPVGDVPVHQTSEPNSPETRAFLESVAPDVSVAACKTILRPEIFRVPRHGTFVVHPGICPEYRNSHGCFWALARRDLDRVGATLLRIDEGVDTGAVFAYYTSDIDERTESHTMIQLRVVYDNIHRIGEDLRQIAAGKAKPIDTRGRASSVWGQPRLSDYLRWKRAARAAV
jgi:folate-dependent phosphoribosylglycinamide formyltransferase PurN